MDQSPEINVRDRMLTSTEAGAVLGVSAQTMRAMKCRGEGPAFIQMGRRVRYEYDALMDWARAETEEAKRRADEAKARQDQAAAHAAQ